ncbi:CLUMA_CG021372, isoform A [Clunio marinus]|uniref:Zinc finger HIT domain-containing protein 3 n=1 Tax=Clunio marinus TaxID=568069 RepID=A0A1J1J895_9DIPT|nr:CLUMA_CG021372, isoform A [Clunio marinus]
METKNCLICNKDGKYKCSQCLKYNCSLDCYKAHKDSEHCIPPIEPEKESITEERIPSNINFFTTIDTVPPEKLQLLENSKAIKELLKNPHLRNFLQEVNSANNAWNAMKLAMMEPLFVEFADECLKIIEPEVLCSLDCYKAHKDSEQCIPPKEPEQEPITEDRFLSNINFFTTIDTVPPEKLQLLENSKAIKELLKNPHLRNFLQEVNSANNAWNAMKLAMMEPLFVEFADECLKIIEPEVL